MPDIFGSGYPAIKLDSTLITFIYAYATIKWQDEYEDITPLSGETVRFYDGSRPIVSINFLNILEDAADGKLYALMNLLNSARNTNSIIEVYPHYSDSLNPRAFPCLVPAAFNLEKLSKVAQGQNITLDFTGAIRYQGIAPYYDSPQNIPWELFTGTLSLFDGSSLEFAQ